MTNSILIFSILFLGGGVSGFSVCLFWRNRFRLKKIFKNFSEGKQIPNVNKIFQQDVDVVLLARKYLSDEGNWEKNNYEHCVSGEKSTLYCVLALAAKTITGQYDDNAAYRHVILEGIKNKFPDRYQNRLSLDDTNDPLKNFNNHRKTTFNDIVELLDGVLLKINNKSLTG